MILCCRRHSSLQQTGRWSASWSWGLFLYMYFYLCVHVFVYLFKQQVGNIPRRVISVQVSGAAASSLPLILAFRWTETKTNSTFQIRLKCAKNEWYPLEHHWAITSCWSIVACTYDDISLETVPNALLVMWAIRFTDAMRVSGQRLINWLEFWARIICQKAFWNSWLCISYLFAVLRNGTNMFHLHWHWWGRGKHWDSFIFHCLINRICILLSQSLDWLFSCLSTFSLLVLSLHHGHIS